MSSKSKNKANRTHKPSGPEHFAPAIQRRIEHRAVVAMTMVGVPDQMAKAIIKTPVRS